MELQKCTVCLAISCLKLRTSQTLQNSALGVAGKSLWKDALLFLAGITRHAQTFLNAGVCSGCVRFCRGSRVGPSPVGMDTEPHVPPDPV